MKIKHWAWLTAESEIKEADGVAKKLRQVTFYAGDDPNETKVVMNDKTLVVVFEADTTCKKVKDRINKLQAGNGKSIGQVVYEQFFRKN